MVVLPHPVPARLPRGLAAVAAALLLLTSAACRTEERADTAGEVSAPPPEQAPAPGAAGEPLTVEGGFQTPESIVHDSAADVYLVSNIHGSPSGKDGNGFISRVSPDGEVHEARWIDGARDGVSLHAPKGMAVHGDTLYVADIDVIRRFDRISGAPRDPWEVAGATFLNGVAVDEAGTVWATDSGLRISEAGIDATGSDAIYRFDGEGGARPVAVGAALDRPNGITTARDGGVVVATFGANLLLRVSAGGQVSQLAELPAGQLDGLLTLPDGRFLVSSWEGEAVYLVDPQGSVRPVLEGVAAPADIGWDERRRRVLVPLFQDDRLHIEGLQLD
jgi:hypothetical protein